MTRFSPRLLPVNGKVEILLIFQSHITSDFAEVEGLMIFDIILLLEVGG
jgi:hypothetical protein